MMAGGAPALLVLMSSTGALLVLDLVNGTGREGDLREPPIEIFVSTAHSRR